MAGIQQLSSAQFNSTDSAAQDMYAAHMSGTWDANGNWIPTPSQNTPGSNGVAPGSLMDLAQPQPQQAAPMYSWSVLQPNQQVGMSGFNALSPADQQRAQTAQRVAQVSGQAQIGQGSMLQGLASGYASAMNPFDQYRSAFAQQLQQLVANPSTINQLPGYQAGITGIESNMATKGQLHSGNVLNALKDYSSNIYNQQVGQLSGLAGANAAPGAGGQVGMQGAIAGSGLINAGVQTQGLGQIAMSPSQSTTNLSQMWQQFAQQMQTNAMNNFR